MAEATHLKLPDIDSQRMQLKINGGKGGKDRYVPMSPRLLDELRAYWKRDRPGNYLFPGQTADVPLSSATVQKACKLAAAQARISKHVTPHTLRHSYATGLLEAGVDLMVIPAVSSVSWFARFARTMPHAFALGDASDCYRSRGVTIVTTANLVGCNSSVVSSHCVGRRDCRPLESGPWRRIGPESA